MCKISRTVYFKCGSCLAWSKTKRRLQILYSVMQNLRITKTLFTFKYQDFKANALGQDSDALRAHASGGRGGGWGVRFSDLVQTGTGAQPASCTKGTGSLYPGVQEVLHGIDHLPPFTADVTVALYFYFLSGSSRTVLGWPIPFSRIEEQERLSLRRFSQTFYSLKRKNCWRFLDRLLCKSEEM